MSKRRLIVLAIVLAVAAACSSGTPEDEDVGARSSGTPAPQGSSSETANSESSDTISDDGDIISMPSDVAHPPTVPPPPPPTPPPAVAVCGNLTIESDEQCDDGNTLSGDGCTSTCESESCGDGAVQAGLGEECDGANLNDSSCVVLGYSVGTLLCGGTCKFDKTDCSSVCGNGTKETGEQCDDGNVSNWDGCNAACEVEPDPTLQSDFSTITGFVIKKKQAAASIVFGQSDTESEDNNVVSLMFPGDPALGPSDNKSTKYATEIATQQSLHFGTYRTRVKFAACDATEEVVNGIFLYSYGGDTNGNGITDNNEIDFEVLCGEPKYLWMTTWTDYPDDGEIGSERHVSHVINMETGSFHQSDPANGDKFSKLGTNPEFIVPGFATSGKYYEIGFEWSSDHLRFFMEKDGKDVTLWNYSDTPDKTQTYIPQNPATFRYNVWHTGSHWWVGGAADYPSNNATMFVDFFKYWAE